MIDGKDIPLPRVDALRDAGIKNPTRLISRRPQIANYDIQGVMGGLREAGFQKPAKLIERFPPIAGLDMQRVFDNFRQLDLDPVNLIERNPPIAGLDMQRVFGDFKEAGFPDPAKLIKEFPPIAGRDIQGVIGKLKETGFQDPVGLIERFPAIVSHDLPRLISEYKEAGFQDPVGLIEKHPKLTSLDMQRVLRELGEAGFQNPVGLVEKHPAIADLSINNINRKIRVIENLNRQFGTEYSAQNLIESFPQYLDFSRSRIFFYLRIAANLQLGESTYKHLLMNNPFLVFSYLLQEIPSSESDAARIVEKIRGLSKDERAAKAAEVKTDLSQTTATLKAQPERENTKFLLQLATHLDAQIR